MQITGTVTRITYQNPTNGFTIALLDYTQNDGKKQHISIKGSMPALKEGMTVRVDGTPEFSPKYGNSLKVQNWSEQRPTDIEGVKKYLASGLIKNIGEVFADKIVSTFGEETLDVLDNNPERLRDIKGIGKKRVESIISALREQREIRDIMVWLKRYDVPNGIAVKIYKQYNGNAIEILESNPYRLADDIGGVGFKKADQVAQQLGIAPTAPFRLRSGVIAVLKDAAEKEGHTCLPVHILTERAISNDYLSVKPSFISETLNDPETDIIIEEEQVSLKKYYYQEKSIARNIRRLMEQPGDLIPIEPDTKKLKEETGFDYSDEQTDAIRAALNEKVVIVTGGPGTGKTATTLAILSELRRNVNAIALAAPTGRAAKRMEEVTKSKATTIHRLLEYGDNGFESNQDNRLTQDAFIIDEVSMIDVQLMNALIKAIPDGATLILVGDADQLPSVGAGNVLNDLINSGAVPVKRLTKIYRQAQQSGIVTNAHLVNHGLPLKFSNNVDSDFKVIYENSTEMIQNYVVDLVSRQIPDIDGIKSEDIQVLCPMRQEYSPIATTQLNRLLQQSLNPHGKLTAVNGETRFREGDRIMQVRNNYKLDIFNGDIGTMLGAITVPNEENAIAEAEFNGNRVKLTKADLNDIELAYACTIHKSQGSEYKAVVIPIHESNYIMLKRNLLYTAITRAKKLCVLIGTQKAINIAIQTQDTAKRNTMLKKHLMEC